MRICCCWLDVLFQPRSSVCATRINLGLMINASMLLASSRRLIFDGPVIALGSVGKADLLSDHFDGKQSMESVDLPLTCHPSSEVRRLLLDLDPYGGFDPLGVFPLFLKRTTDVLVPRLSEVFWRRVRLGSFPACWRQANVTPITKGPPSSSVANYRPISMTSVLVAY